ncbi:50S ribosomal protein L11 methyltransferase [candidate division KSB1 bacterium]|nr:50S ribosomal protein L11 methyltransferase [candidate division KSB1 bacterium]
MFSPKEFIELKISINPQIEDELANYLIEQGSTGCISEKEELIAYFPDRTWSDDLLEKIISYIDELNIDYRFNEPVTVLLDKIIEKDYNAEWKKSLKAIEIVPGLIIKPSWVTLTSHKEGDIIIEIDPQMAFGSGMHATTRLILELMHEYCKDEDAVIDVGTGSGILAIAAMKMGCERVIAFDNDPIAGYTARDNIIKNGTNDGTLLFVGTIDSVRNVKAAVILMNINRAVIIDISERVNQCLQEGGYIIVSGVLIQESEIVIQRFRKLSYDLIDDKKMDEWIALVFKKCSRQYE